MIIILSRKLPIISCFIIIKGKQAIWKNVGGRNHQRVSLISTQSKFHEVLCWLTGFELNISTYFPAMRDIVQNIFFVLNLKQTSFSKNQKSAQVEAI